MTDEKKGTLCLDSGSTLTSEEDILRLDEPTGSTDTHIKLGHRKFLGMVKDELDQRHIGHRQGEYALTTDKECMFGLIQLDEFSLPTVDAQNQMYVDTDLSTSQRHHMLIRFLNAGILPASQIRAVEDDYLLPPEAALRDNHSYRGNAWRFLQAYTQVMRTGGKFQTHHARLEAISDRTQQARKILTRYCDPNGEKLAEMQRQERLFDTHNSVTKSYRYVLGVRNSNNKRFPAGLVMGIAPFVCDNLCFFGEVEVSRRHTKNIMSDLPERIKTRLDQLITGNILN